jgi:hypothetical protein
VGIELQLRKVLLMAAELQVKRARLAEIGPEIERLVALAAQLDGLDEIALKLSALKRERSALAALRAAELGKVDPEALRALLRGERMRVGPDPEQGYAIRGTAWLDVGSRLAPGTRGLRRVAGGRYARVSPCCRWPLPLPVRGRVGAAAA